MAHEIETMAYAGQVPWHGLGEKVSSDMTPKQMLEAAKLDWTVSRSHENGNCRKLKRGQRYLGVSKTN